MCKGKLIWGEKTDDEVRNLKSKNLDPFCDVMDPKMQRLPFAAPLPRCLTALRVVFWVFPLHLLSVAYPLITTEIIVDC